ncbi:unnamed protein product [Amoebophrya sp. A120]|nr:unnamed protein product [Amoebophrya sp. A120]|eukprot:GSA120T00008135001.1
MNPPSAQRTQRPEPPGVGRRPAAGGSSNTAGWKESARDRRTATSGKPLRIGTFNVLTLGSRDTGSGERTAQMECLIRDAKERRLDVLATQESRVVEWIHGEKADGYKLYGGGAWKNSSGTPVGGVLFLVRDGIEVQDVDAEQWGRHARITLATRCGRKMHLHGIYAPTDAADGDEKDKFWTKTAKKISDHPARDIVMVVGDYNAEMGEPQWELMRASLPYAVGPCGLTPDFVHRSDNGRRLQQFAATAELLDVSSLYQRKWSKRFTFTGNWSSTTSRARREYDRALISWKHRGLLRGFRVYADTYLASDHRLVVVEVDVKVPRKKKKNAVANRWVRTKEAAEALDKELQAKYDPATVEERMTNSGKNGSEWWDDFEAGLRMAIEKLSKGAVKAGPRKPWISQETWERIETRKKWAAKGVNKMKLNQIGRKIRACIKEDKRAWVAGKIEELRKADNAGRTPRGVLLSSTRTTSELFIGIVTIIDEYLKTGKEQLSLFFCALYLERIAWLFCEENGICHRLHPPEALFLWTSISHSSFLLSLSSSFLSCYFLQAGGMVREEMDVFLALTTVRAYWCWKSLCFWFLSRFYLAIRFHHSVFQQAQFLRRLVFGHWDVL